MTTKPLGHGGRRLALESEPLPSSLVLSTSHTSRTNPRGMEGEAPGAVWEGGKSTGLMVKVITVTFHESLAWVRAALSTLRALSNLIPQ